MTSQTPIDIVTTFLDDLARSDTAAALENVDENIAYTNVSLPTVHGKRKVAGIFSGMDRYSWAGFNYRMVNVTADGPVVLTERVDELRFGPVVMQFWVCGRFEVREGRITVWRDYFDYYDMTKALVRGLLGAVIPPLRKPLPPKVVAV
ncbi:limonene-1,2-epoxide hydrolase family protein [Gordonia sp. Z-3]|jgi:limonene-1,2-epoxide hydrolase|uniref:Nuclear transport factor 2 family protein n=1 Tax=Gordonia aquimaris TaxID=2984863 RepID=A0A9X3I303_9ACTN|nr:MULTISPECIES: limonene-1,2-epoxide hydrolase family protein [Gordonia]MAU82000.1 limonene-1,2-epoxide hydrolase [Gordonia sp. (in: high G+C Gram-positive bacteria)]MCX2962666.1 nuclear transport factor 2 family protein [Gordonia aquimaris]MED5799810.1 limonene-1,2-epoxide hydrolase family protein [Gordonia sp. Z-3]